MQAAFSFLRRGFGCAAVVSTVALPAVAAERVFAIDAVEGRVPPAQQKLRVTQGDSVVIDLTSTTRGEAHLHGYKLAAKLEPGKPAQWRFVAKASGRFRVEWHAEGSTASHHHGPPFATLDVMPK